MKEYDFDDTIAAIATPYGQGAISIVRLSGKEAFAIVKKIFISEQDFDQAENWKAIFGKIVHGNRMVDEAVVLKYQAPHSYTREDMVEINCHGGIYVTQRILELLLDNGARLAEPGEFTLRAFLNGRIDLSQAEAVADLIQSQTEVSLQSSIRQLQGELSKKINLLRDELMQSCSLLELELDFAEEDVEFVDRKTLIKRIDEIQQEFDQLLSTYQSGRIAREGVKLVISGKPNVGKSSLLNALVNEERAIVTDIPGTTRDALEVKLDIKGVLFRIFDTAGIKDAEDIVEQEGIRRSRKYIEQADIIIHVFDGSQPLTQEDLEIIKFIEEFGDKKILRVINKSDLKQRLKIAEIEHQAIPVVKISALKKRGIKEVEKKLLEIINSMGDLTSTDAMITNFRHFMALKRAVNSLQLARKELLKEVSSEYIALYLRESLDYLGEITGKVTSEDILNNIFSQFCIGK